MNLASIIEAHPDDSVALVSRGKETTYGELRSQVAALRGGLYELGVRPGDRVAIATGNNWYFVSAYLATLGLGAIAVPLNPLAPAPELQRELAVTEASVLVAGPSAKQPVNGIDRTTLPALEYVVASPDAGIDDSVDLDQLLASDPIDLVDREADQLAVLMFTSGTAGPPRAAMLSHGNLLANLEQVQASPSRNQTEDDVVFGVLPLFHIFGLNVVLGLTLMAGARVVLIERFDPVSALEAIENHRITVVTGPPTMWSAWSAIPSVDPKVFSSVRIAVSGAAKLAVETGERDRGSVRSAHRRGLWAHRSVTGGHVGQWHRRASWLDRLTAARCRGSSRRCRWRGRTDRRCR